MRKNIRKYVRVLDMTGYGSPHFCFMQCQYCQPDYCQTPLLTWASFCAKTEVKKRTVCKCYWNRVENRLKKSFRVFLYLLVFWVNQLQKVSVMHFHIAFYVYFTMQHFTVPPCGWKKILGIFKMASFPECGTHHIAEYGTLYIRFVIEYKCQISSFVLTWYVYLSFLYS